jgi:mannose-1-phosphate guanylyltransferase
MPDISEGDDALRYAVILAGGSGTRLWPMSREELPKQLIAFIQGKSLLTLAFERLEGLVEPQRRFICAGKRHRHLILHQLKGLAGSQFLGEPQGRDTLNAIGFTCAVIAKMDPEAAVAVVTGDQLIEPQENFRRVIREALSIVEAHPKTLIIFGIKPTRPATGFGYLELGGKFRGDSRLVTCFKEKPDLSTAEHYLREGPERYLWNSGMFVWRAKTFLEVVRQYEPEVFAGLAEIGQSWGTPAFEATIEAAFPRLRRISVDLAVMERASVDPAVTVAALMMDVQWLDIGSWPACTAIFPKDGEGNALGAEKSLLLDTTGTLVASSDPNHLITAIGCQDLIVIHTPSATLVCPKDRAEEIKKLHGLVKERFEGKYI